MMRYPYHRAAFGVAMVAVLTTAPHAQQANEWTPALTPVTSPAAPGSAQPQLSVSSRGVLLSWIEREGPRATLKFAERTATGWSAPVTVSSGDNWFVNWADVPSVVRLANGTLAAHWLQKSGPETYAYDVRLAYSTDDGRTWSPSFLRPIAAFRNRTDDEVRDIYISRFENGVWTASKAVHDDGWNIPACPVNGPMLSARGRDVAIAWFTVSGDQGHAFAAFSKDAGRTFGAPIRLDDGVSLGRVDIELLEDGSALATWIEFAEQKSQVRARRISPSGSRSAAFAVAALEGSRASGYPRLARHGDELVFAWTNTGAGTPRVQTAVATLPARGGR